MSPIRITPQVPVHVCSRERELLSTPPTKEVSENENIIFVLPEGKSEYYIMKVNSFSHSPGGIIESKRIQPGHDTHELTLTTKKDHELSEELGLSSVTIDEVIYTAINPKKTFSYSKSTKTEIKNI